MVPTSAGAAGSGGMALHPLTDGHLRVSMQSGAMRDGVKAPFPRRRPTRRRSPTPRVLRDQT
ncbi:hypothetical protein [Azospirillum melinis]